MASILGKSIGRYHILEQLGQGGMATVYKAYDTRLEREVAIKIIRKEAFPSEVHERMLKRFEREAKSLAKLQHPNIVKVYDYGEFEGAPYLIMELLSGGTLKEYSGTAMSTDDAARLLAPIARALAYAHENGILHRDVKPSNILITSAGDPILTDFGIAKLLESDQEFTLTGTNVGVGTPEYMAPEQGLGKNVDGRADLYALGIVFYELITARKPYIADTPLAVLYKQMNDPLPLPKDLGIAVPKNVQQILLKALAKNPVDRYQSMSAFANKMEELYSGTKTVKGADQSLRLSVPDKTYDSFEVINRGTKKRKNLVITALIILVSILFVWMYVIYLQPLKTETIVQPTMTEGILITDTLPNTIIPESSDTTLLLQAGKIPEELVEKNLLLYDDFTTKEYDGVFDDITWRIKGNYSSEIAEYYQEDNVLIGVVNPNKDIDFELHSNNQYYLSEIDYIEWKLGFENWTKGEWAAITPSLEFSDGERISCDFVINPQNEFLRCVFWGNHPMKDIPIHIPIKQNEWYVFRIEIENDPIKYKFYLNEKIIGTTSEEYNQTENSIVHICTGLGATKTSQPLIGYIDYIYIVGK